MPIRIRRNSLSAAIGSARQLAPSLRVHQRLNPFVCRLILPAGSRAIQDGVKQLALAGIPRETRYAAILCCQGSVPFRAKARRSRKCQDITAKTMVGTAEITIMESADTPGTNAATDCWMGYA